MTEYVDDRLIASINEEMNYWKIPGTAFAVIKDGKVIVEEGIGLSDIDDGKPVDAKTMFCIASLSKSMTVALCAILAGKGILSWDKPIKTYVEGFDMWDKEAGNQLTLRDIFCHISGLGGHDGIWPDTEVSREIFLQRLKFLEPNAKFREKAQYSNVMYGAVACILEHVTGCSYEHLLKEYILDPLGMTRTTCYTRTMQDDNNHAEPYGMINDELIHLNAWDCGIVCSAANINSCAHDMAKWICMMARGGLLEDGRRLIPESYFKAMTSPQVDFHDPAEMDDDCYSTSKYGMGWCCGEYRDNEIIIHTGKIEGYSSLQAVLPSKNMGIVMLMNFHTPAVPTTYGFAYTMFDKMLGFDGDIDWMEKLRGRDLAEGPEGSEYLDCNVNVFEDRKYDSNKLMVGYEDICGTYVHPGYGYVIITCEDNKLFIALRNQPKVELDQIEGNIFAAKGIKEDILTMRVPVRIIEGKDEVIAITIALEPLVRDVTFMKQSV